MPNVKKPTRHQAMKFAQQMVMDNVKMKLELKSALLLNYILVQRMGGRAEVTQEEFNAGTGQLIVANYDAENKWVFLCAPAEEPAAEEPTPLIEVVGS